MTTHYAVDQRTLDAIQQQAIRIARRDLAFLKGDEALRLPTTIVTKGPADDPYKYWTACVNFGGADIRVGVIQKDGEMQSVSGITGGPRDEIVQFFARKARRHTRFNNRWTDQAI